MKKFIQLFITAGIVIIIMSSMIILPVQAASNQQDDWLTTAIAKALGYSNLNALMSSQKISLEPGSVYFQYGTLESNEGGNRSNEVYREGVLYFYGDDSITVQFTQQQIQAIQDDIDDVFPYDYFDQLPGDYTLIGIAYESQTEGGTRYPSFSVTSTDMAIGTYSDIKNFSNVIDVDTLTYVDINDMVDAYVTGYHGDDTVSISSDFAASDVYTTVRITPSQTTSKQTTSAKATATPAPTQKTTTSTTSSSLAVKEIKASIEMNPSSSGTTFWAANMIDGKETTCWQYRVKDGDAAAYLYITFSQKADVASLWIKNGFWKTTNGNDQYTRNSRPKTIELSFKYSGSTQYKNPIRITLNDDTVRKSWQKHSFDTQEDVIVIKIRIVSIYTGNKYPKDVAISEIAFYGP